MKTKVFSVNTVATFPEGYTITEIVYDNGRSLYRILDTFYGEIEGTFTSYVEAILYLRNVLKVNGIGR